MRRIHQISPAKQNYDWGGYHFLYQFLDESDERPLAELWFGDHAKGEANVFVDNRNLTMSNWLKLHQFQSLPFLLKLLDVQSMLSIQSHPDKQYAQEGFDKENEAGIPIDAPNRIFRDPNDKPEMMVSLSDFWLLHGFDHVNRIIARFEQYDSTKRLADLVKTGSIQTCFQEIMRLPQEEINRILKPLGKEIKPLFERNMLDKTNHNFWAAKAFLEHNVKGKCDRGILLIYMMNLVFLNKGEGIYQPANLLHAYLEGQTIELMKNSDNVFRAGLTKKQLATTELMSTISFDQVVPEILRSGKQHNEWVNWPVPNRLFNLSAIHLQSGNQIEMTTEGLEIWIVLSGNGTIEEENATELRGPAAYLLEPGIQGTIKSDNHLEIFKAC